MRSLAWITPSLAALLLSFACSKAPEAPRETETAAPAKPQAAPASAAGEAPSEAPSREPADVAAPGTTARGQGFVVEVTPPSQVPVGAEVVAEVHLRPTDGYKVNKDFPTSLVVSADPGVEIVDAEQTPEEAVRFEEKGAAFQVRFKAAEAGTKAMSATFKFAVCTDTTCDPKREKLAWNIEAR